MMTFHCYIPGIPVAKGRPRFTRAGHTYTPARTERWESHAAVVLRETWGGGPPLHDDPLHLGGVFIFPRPQRLCRSTDPPARVPMTSRPDLDNLVKSLADALQLAGIVLDDKSICSTSATKYYAEKNGEGPGTHVWLCPYNIASIHFGGVYTLADGVRRPSL